MSKTISNLPRFGTRASVRSSDLGLEARRLPHNALKLTGTTRGGELELSYGKNQSAKVTLSPGMTPLQALLKLRGEVPVSEYLLPIDRSDATSLIFGVRQRGKKNEPFDVTSNIRSARGPGTESGPVITKRELDALVRDAQRDGLTRDEKAELARGISTLIEQHGGYLTRGATDRYRELVRELELPSLSRGAV